MRSELQQPWKGWSGGESLPGKAGIDGESGELVWVDEGLISRQPSWPAAPDRELGKGQSPRAEGGLSLQKGLPRVSCPDQ